MSNQTKIKIYGPPGTGKTTCSLNLLCDHLQAGDRVLFVSFTRAAKIEAERRLLTTFGSVPEFATVSTIHALCMRILGIPKSCLFERNITRKKFFDSLGITLPGKRTKAGHFVVDTLNRHQRIRNMTCEWDEEMCDAWMDPQAMKSVIDQYEGWKRHDGYIDFTDILQKVAAGEGEIPKYDAVIIDEAQDLTRLQWRVAERLYANASTVYAVGDDDQNVYSFLGVDVGHFITWPCDATRVLDHSYRLPRQILAYSQYLAHRIKFRQEKKITGTDREGEIFLNLPLTEYLDYGKRASELFLVRNTYMARRVQTMLVQLGVPFRSDSSPYTSTWSASGQVFKTIQILHKWKDGSIQKQDWQQIKKHMAPMFAEIVEETYKGATEDTPGGIPSLKGFVMPTMDYERKFWWEDFLLYVHPQNVSIFKNALKYYTLEQCANPVLEVSTLHGSKGKEADRVYVCSALTKRLFGTLDHEDHEHRLFYVGVTRSRDELIVVDDPEAGSKQYPFPNYLEVF